jgi:hypothetical protein
MTTIESLVNEDILICDLSLEDIQRFKTIYYNKRIPLDLRENIKERERFLKRKDIEDAAFKRLQKKLFGMFIRTKSIYEEVPSYFDFGADDFDLVRYHGRNISNDLHDLPGIYTGFESVENQRCQLEDKRYKSVQEHMWPRQWCGEYIVHALLEHGADITIKELVLLVYRFSHVHRVTPVENQLLRKYQRSHEFISPEHTYKEAGIQLIRTSEKIIPVSWKMCLDFFCNQ